MPDSSIPPETVTSGPFVAFVSMQVQAVAVGWQVYALTGRALDLGYADAWRQLTQFSSTSERSARRYRLTMGHIFVIRPDAVFTLNVCG